MYSNLFTYITTAIVVFLIASFAVFTLRKLVSLIIKKRYGNELKGQTNISFIKNSISFVVYFGALIVVFIQIPPLKDLGSTLFAGAGIIAAIVGFASQKAFSNIISGVFVILFRPFSVGDTIEPSSGRKGVVEEITLRHIVIRDYENRRIIIPNSAISDDVIINSNITEERIRKHVHISISYDSDVEKAMKIFKEEAEKHPLCLDNRTKKQIEDGEDKVLVLVLGLSDFSVDLRAYVWTENNDTGFIMTTDLYKKVKKRFDAEGIEIPFPHRTLVFKNHLNLKNKENKQNNQTN